MQRIGEVAIEVSSCEPDGEDGLLDRFAQFSEWQIKAKRNQMNATGFLRSIMTLIVMVTLPFHGSAENVDPYGLSLARLREITEHTASRDLTSIEEAPVEMTVVTGRQGVKTLRDVLDRVPGFFDQWDRNFSRIAIRGYTQVLVSNVLSLVDGHSINSQAGEGIGNTHLLPLFYQAKQIEIIRAPGATLWGGDAALGIINIITYDGADLAEKGEHSVKVSLDYEFDTQRRIANVLYGTQFSDDDLMISPAYTESPYTQVIIIPVDGNQSSFQKALLQHGTSKDCS